MKKNLFSKLLTLCLICFGMLPAIAQQNQKLLFPTPNGFQSSDGLEVTPTADGGFLLLGKVDGTDWNTIGVDVRPRLIKLDANLNVVWDQLYVPPQPGRGGLTFPKGHAFEMPDGDFMIGLHNDSSDVHVIRVNADGSLQAGIQFPGLYERFGQVLGLLNTDNTLVYVQSNSPAIKHLDPLGNIIYNKVIGLQGIEEAPAVLANGDLLFHKFNFNQVTRTDNLGNVIWQIQPVADNYVGSIALPNGGFGLYYFNASINNKWRIRFYDDAGLETGVSPVTPIPDGELQSLKGYPDGTFLASGKTVTNRGYLMRFNADGTVVWSAESPEDGQVHLNSAYGTPTTGGWAVAAGSAVNGEMGFMRISDNTGFFVNTLTGSVLKDNDESCTADAGEPVAQHAHVFASNGLENFDAFTNGQGKYQLLLPSGNFTVTATPNEPFLFQCPTAANTVTFAPNTNGNATVDLPIQSLDIIHLIKGKVTMDQNADCIADPADPAAGQWDLALRYGTTGAIGLKTNNDGEYQIFVPEGDYSLELRPWNSNFGICGQAKRQISLVGTAPLTQTEDFVAFPEINCSQMAINIDGTRMRPCSTGTVNVYYQNRGTIDANNPTLEVTLDAAMSFVSASPAPTSVVGNILKFELGQVAPSPNCGGYHEIKIKVLADCNLQIGQHICVSGIVSSSPCLDPASWQGAIVAVEGECSPTSDSVIFKIRNIGNGPNAGMLQYIIDEDQIVLRQGPFQLPAGGVQVEAVLPMSNTSTVSITAQQEPGAPGDTLVSYSLTDCVGMSGGAPSGWGGYSGPYGNYQCFEIANSYDPNEKTAFPIGVGDKHLVNMGTPLEYTIHFQNTGNDTAFLVILRDTISDKMDCSKIELMGASHPFEFAQINDSILHIRFDNILLPDSMTNPEASKGSFSFKIYPKSEMPEGTVVPNHAAIYFDQNPPIITNTVLRTYSKFYTVSTNEQKGAEQVRVSVSPNPFVEETTFELPGDMPVGSYMLQVFDAAGKQIRSQFFAQNRCLLSRECLAEGLYFWSITEAGKVLASGKIVAGN